MAKRRTEPSAPPRATQRAVAPVNGRGFDTPQIWSPPHDYSTVTRYAPVSRAMYEVAAM
jgi:hypothetical protein